MPELEAERRVSWQSVVLFLLTLLLVVLCISMLSPFVSAVTWAVALAVATRPAYLLLERRLGRPGVAAMLMTVLVLLLVVGPMTFVADQVIRQLLRVARMVQTGEMQEWTMRFADHHHWAARVMDEAGEITDFKGGMQAAAGFVAGRLRGILLGSIGVVTELAVMLFALFFLYRDGDEARLALLSVMPLGRAEAEGLLRRIAAAISATLLGRLTIALVQGMLGGVMFLLLGVPHPGIWALMMAATGMVPMVGTLMVWGPVALYLAVTDHVVRALVMVGWGAGVVSTVDNLLYPTLVGAKLRMHTLPTFFAVLGGVAVFGLSGLVLGPVVLVGAVELLRIWRPGALGGGGAPLT